MIKKQIKVSVKNLEFYIVLSDNYLHGIHWSKQKLSLSSALTLSKDSQKIFDKTIKELSRYLDGKLTDFSVPLKLEGTTFQLKVWSELRKIPYGQKISYKELAKAVGVSKAYRAVGTANSKNPISIIVPCHRVVRSDGEIGGYAGGLAIKARLLGLELGKS